VAAHEVMERYLASVRSGDWETAYGFFAADMVGHVPGRSALAGELRGRDAAIAYIERASAESQGNEVEVELVDTLSSAERVMLLVRERFTRGREIVEIERANVYTVRGEKIAEVWIFEADQYGVDELLESV
jgi:ketosteroid isomerase-like protein